MENEKKKKSFKMKDANKNEILTMKNLGEIKSVLLNIMEKNKTETLQNYGLDEIEFYDPRKEKIDDSGIKIKYAGFNLIYNEEAREKINKFLKEKIGINDGIKGIDIEKFKITKAEYKEAKKDFNNKLKKISEFIEICCKYLEKQKLAKDSFKLAIKDNKLNEFNKELEYHQFEQFKKYKSEKSINLNIRNDINELKYKIEKSRKNLYSKADIQASYYKNFAKNLKECIKIIDNKINDKTDDLQQALEFIKQGLKLEREYLLTKDKRGKDNNKNLINAKYNSLKEYLDISDYYAESELEYSGEYVTIDENKEKVMKQIFGIKKPEYVKDEWKPDIKKWKPSIDDIQQGHIGDCYLLAALQSLFQTSKGIEDIKECFVNFEDIYEDNCTKFQFYKLKLKCNLSNNNLSSCQAEGTEKVSIIVENKVLKNNGKHSGNESGKLWVNLFEKAFAAYRKDKSNFDMSGSKIKELNPNDKKFFDGIIGNGVSAKFALGNVASGYAFIPLAAITGKGNCCYNIYPSSINSLKKGDCISFWKLPEILKNKEYLVTGHEYSILNVYNYNGKDCLELKNPWNGEECYDFTKLNKKLNEINDKDENSLETSILNPDNNDYKRGTIKLRREQITPEIVNLIQSS